jgi:hypothetical protein
MFWSLEGEIHMCADDAFEGRLFRGSTKIMASTARDSKITRLTGICKKLAARVETLENENAQLNIRLSNFEEEDIGGAMVDEEEAKARVFGRPPLKDRGQMELDRDQILSFLSTRWIEISQLLAGSTTANELQAGFFENYIAPKLISHRGLDILFNNASSLFYSSMTVIGIKETRLRSRRRWPVYQKWNRVVPTTISSRRRTGINLRHSNLVL